MFAHTSILKTAAFAFTMIFVFPAAAQPTTPTTPTTFTYQGSLTSSGSPLTGQADLRATLFSSATDVSPFSSTLELPNVTVTNGLFTIPLDFGPAFDQGQSRWLELSVRAPAGSGSFTTLQPRQAITPTPLAQGLAGIAITRGGPEVLDQAQDQLDIVFFNVDINPPNWQTWTPARTGALTRIQLLGFPSGTAPQTLTVRIRFGEGLTGPVLASVTAPFNSENAFVPNSISIPNLAVQAGIPYTLEFSGPVSLRLAASQIPGATGVRGSNPQNWWFRTFVTPVASINAASTSTAFASVAAAALSANTATNVPWSGLTGQAAVTTPAIGTNWQFLFHNTSIASFRGGARLSDAGFLELTNTANLASPNFARLSSAGTWSAVSDARLKTDVTTAHNNLAAALQLRPVHFRWKDSGTADFGLIAQEVRSVLPSLVSGDESKDTLTLNYSQLSVVAIGAIQELKAKYDRELQALEAELAQAREESATLRSRLDRLEKLLPAPTFTPSPKP